MIKHIDIYEFFNLRQTIPIIDVRSDKEFIHAHISNAINLPLFSDIEREKVGISYKHEGRQAAILLGLEFVGKKLPEFAQKALKYAKSNKLILYCWRGGMRSSSMAWLFDTVGIDVYLLKGGYKTYRKFAQKTFAQKANYIVIGGMTGSGKTKILEELQLQKEQVIDLEGLANHKGSAFGMLGQMPQSTTEQFENNLFEILHTFNTHNPIWIEDESRSIGRICIPDSLFKHIRNAPVINIEIPNSKRIDFLLKEYGNFPKEDLKSSILKIQKRLGGEKTKLAIEYLNSQKIAKAIEIVLEYYDKTYKFGLSKRENKMLTIHLSSMNHRENANKIIKFAYNNLQ